MEGKVTFGKIAGLIFTVIVILVLKYLLIPPLSLNYAYSIWCYSFMGALFLAAISRFFKEDKDSWIVAGIVFGGIMLAVFVIMVISSFVSWAAFRHSDYYKQLGTVEEKNYVDEINPIDLSQVPYIDEEYAKVLGEKTLGQQADLGSIIGKMYKTQKHNIM